MANVTIPAELPIVQAPMAGGPSTPALAAAVAAAGGYGFVAGGYLSPEGMRDAIVATRQLTNAPLGVNMFVPCEPGDADAVAAYAAALQPEADRLGVALGEPVWDDDRYQEKLEVAQAAKVHMVSFTFGCPAAATVDQLHGADIRVAVTVTSAQEAKQAADAGVDVVVVQGTEAGGHQGSFADRAVNQTPLLSLLNEIGDTTAVPMIGTGGVMTGRDAAAVLRAGAIAVQLGTALLCAPEAGTSRPYREALLNSTYDDTIVTRAYSGRYGRGLKNRFAVEHDGEAPEAYPEVNHLTRPLRTAATRAGDDSVPNLWAGTGWRQITTEPASSIVRRIADDARRALSFGEL